MCHDAAATAHEEPRTDNGQAERRPRRWAIGAGPDARPLTAAELRTSAVDGPRSAPAPRLRPVSRRRLIVVAALIVAAIVGLYLLIPRLAGLNQTWGRLQRGDPLWLALAAVLEIVSIAGYTLLFRTVFSRGVPRLSWRVSLQIPLAGIAAIRLFAAAGAGGVAVTVWALGRAGTQARVIACRMVASLTIQYGVYLGSLVAFGVALGIGVLPGPAPFALTFLPAAIAGFVAAVLLSAALLPADLERRLRAVHAGPRWWRRGIGWAANVPDALGSGVRTAVELIRERRLGLLGAIAYWGFDIAVLGCSFRAFGGHPAVAVLVLGYLIGTLGSLLPLPGGIGGVEGGMIAAFVAFSTPTDQTVVSVLAYRAISFWLPTLPGIAGYLALRRTVARWERLDARSATGRSPEAARADAPAGGTS